VSRLAVVGPDRRNAFESIAAHCRVETTTVIGWSTTMKITRRAIVLLASAAICTVIAALLWPAPRSRPVPDAIACLTGAYALPDGSHALVYAKADG
jgi:hypothetical protein